ncbi:MAG TPA: hypothetical protein VF546_24240 [Pyrinomonadaceae bacterium]|jgi:hypothetical protein
MKTKLLTRVLLPALLALCAHAPTQAQTVMEWMVLTARTNQQGTATINVAAAPNAQTQCPAYLLFDINGGPGLFAFGACPLDAGADNSVFGFEPQPIAAAP